MNYFMKISQWVFDFIPMSLSWYKTISDKKILYLTIYNLQDTLMH